MNPNEMALPMEDGAIESLNTQGLTITDLLSKCYPFEDIPAEFIEPDYYEDEDAPPFNQFPEIMAKLSKDKELSTSTPVIEKEIKNIDQNIITNDTIKTEIRSTSLATRGFFWFTSKSSNIFNLVQNMVKSAFKFTGRFFQW